MAKKEEDNVDFNVEGKLSTDEILDIIGELPPEKEEAQLPEVEDGFLSEDEIDRILNLGGDSLDDALIEAENPFIDEGDDSGDSEPEDQEDQEAELAFNFGEDGTLDFDEALLNFSDIDIFGENPLAPDASGENEDLSDLGEEEAFPEIPEIPGSVVTLGEDFEALLAELSENKEEEADDIGDVDEYGDVDDDINFDMDAFDDEGFEIYEKVNALEDDLEKARDFDVTGSFASQEDLAFVSDVTVYETFDREDPFADAVKKAEEEALKGAQAGKDVTTVIKNVSESDETEENAGSGVSAVLADKVNVNTILLVFLILLLLISLGVGSAVVSGVQKATLPADQSFVDAEPVIPPKVMYNNSNFVYLDTTVGGNSGNSGNSDALSLVKFHSDQEASAFYFTTEVEWAKYDVSLRDDFGREYKADLRVHQKDYIRDKLFFEPLDTGIKGLSLTITNKETGDAQEFLYRFENGLSLTSAAYFRPKKNVYTDEHTTVSIDHAVFSSTGTSLVYDITWTGEERLDFGSISLYEGSKRIMANESLHEQFFVRELLPAAEDETPVTMTTMIGSVEFGPVTMLNSPISIEFKDVYRTYDRSRTIDLAELMANTEEAQVKLPAGDHTITLERFGRMGNFYVLVLHGETLDGLRTETFLQGSLVLTASDGTKTRLEADVKSASIGTDMVFDASDVDGTIVAYEFELDNIYLKAEDIRAKVDLGNLPRTKDTGTHSAHKAIESGGDYLLEQGYSQVQNMMYYKNGSTIYLKYIGLRNGRLNEAYLIGQQDGLSWHFSNWTNRN